MSAGTRPRGNTRVTGKEQFYTPREIASYVVARVCALVPEVKMLPWLEPCAGTGNFTFAMHEAGVSDVISFDLHPAHPGIAAQDFFTFLAPRHDFVTVTNPPFGRNNALSVPFFNHAAKMSSCIAFIVPRSWRKWSVQNRLNRNFRLLSDEDLSVNYVDADNRLISAASLLRTCLQIWIPAEGRRPLTAVEDRGLIARATPDTADVALTIFGRGCGTVTDSFPRDHKITTQMYLRLLDDRAFDALKTADFSPYFNRVAYTEALSIHEVNAALNREIFGDELILEVD